MTNRFAFLSWLQAAGISSTHRYHTVTETEAQSAQYVNKTRLPEKQHQIFKAYQKKMHNVSSTKCKHGVHRVLYSHKVPGQKGDTRRVHLSDRKHRRYLRSARQNLTLPRHTLFVSCSSLTLPCTHAGCKATSWAAGTRAVACAPWPSHRV